MCGYVAAKRSGDLAAVEGLGALGAEAFQRLGQLREAEDVPFAQRPSVGCVELPGLIQPLVDRPEDLEDVGLLGVDRGALTGKLHAGPRQLGKRRRAEPLQRQLQTCRGPRYATGRRPDVERLHGLLIEVDRDGGKLHPAFGPVLAGRRDEEVDQDRLLAAADHHEAAGAEARQGTLDGKGGEDGRDRGVDSVAAGAQDIGSRLGGKRVPRRDHAGHGVRATQGGTQARPASSARRPSRCAGAGHGQCLWCAESSARRRGAAWSARRSGWRRR